MLARVASDGTVCVPLATLCDALVDEARAQYAAFPSTPSLPDRVVYAPRDPARGVLAALEAGRADCVTLACAEAGRLQARGAPASVVLSTVRDASDAIHARVVIGARTMYDPSKGNRR